MSYSQNMYKWLKRQPDAEKLECPGIYSISIDGQIVYIGKSYNMLKRKAEHFVGITTQSEHKYEILNEARRHGLSVQFHVLYYAKAKYGKALEEELGSKEGEYIRQYYPMLNTQIPKADNWRKYEINKKAASVTLADILLGRID